MLAHCIMTLSSVLPAVAGSMNAFILGHLIIQMFVVRQAPMHACALHYDTIECLASRCWQHECIIQMFMVLQAPMHACAL